MALITLPDAAAIKSIEWDLDQPAQVNRSAWTFRRQVVTQPGPAMWSATADFVTKIGEAYILEAEAFLVDLEGQVNTFRLVAVENPQMPVACAPVVDGVGQSGRSLALRGGTPASFLRRGHKLTVNDQMVMLMAPLVFGDDGKAIATFKPDLRLSPGDGNSVEVIYPYALVALTDSKVGWSVNPGQSYQAKQIAVEEAF